MPNAATVTLVGAGDIADCSNVGGSYVDATAKLLDGIDGTVFTAGDNAYPDGSMDNFNTCYAPRWGRQRARTRPAAGNHDYATAGAAAYYQYFGAAAGPSGLGYYSYTAGGWHVIVLNSNIDASSGSAQVQWLRDDLSANRTFCTAVIFHHPLFTSGPSGGNAMRDVWRVLYDANADLVINGHDHLYERFAPQDPDGRADAARGIREFIVGTGGAPLYPFGAVMPNSEARMINYGVLRLTLRPDGYEWAFIDSTTQGPIDSGAGMCH